VDLRTHVTVQLFDFSFITLQKSSGFGWHCGKVFMVCACGSRVPPLWYRWRDTKCTSARSRIESKALESTQYAHVLVFWQ
jgi:hypothetical protein